MIDSLKGRLNRVKLQGWLTWRLLRDGRVPLWTKAIPVLTLVYVFSPIDLIPDFILALGQIDDVVILTLGMSMFERLSPPAVVAEHRRELDPA